MIEVPSLGDAIAMKNKILSLEKKLKTARIEISHLKKKLKSRKCESKKIKIIKLLESGASLPEIINEHGYNASYVYVVNRQIGHAKKRRSTEESFAERRKKVMELSLDGMSIANACKEAKISMRDYYKKPPVIS